MPTLVKLKGIGGAFFLSVPPTATLPSDFALPPPDRARCGAGDAGDADERILSRALNLHGSIIKRFN